MMKKRSIILFLFGGICYVALSGNASGPGTVTAVDGTGVNTTGCSCHNLSATSTTSVSMQLLSGATPVTTYTPGATYTIRVTGSNSSTSLNLPRFGYQVTAMKTGSTTVNAGTLSAPAGSHTVAVTGGVKLVEHSTALTATSGTGGSGTQYVVNVPWTAPAAGTGSVTLRSVINAVNFNGSTSGDGWNTASLAVSEATATVVSEVAAGELKLFPNPGKGDFSLQLPASVGGPAHVVIANMAGATVKEFTVTSNVANVTTKLPAGIYLLSATTAVGNYTTRFVIE
jgi:hypothetical protein